VQRALLSLRHSLEAVGIGSDEVEEILASRGTDLDLGLEVGPAIAATISSDEGHS